jgi:transposase
LSVLAAIGDIHRFPTPDKLVSYLGLNPSVHQSGDHPAYHGRISKQGRSQARAMLVETIWSIANMPDPLRAFFQRISAKRGKQVAAIATARQADGSDLAHAHQRRGLRMGAASTASVEVSRA